MKSLLFAIVGENSLRVAAKNYFETQTKSGRLKIGLARFLASLPEVSGVQTVGLLENGKSSSFIFQRSGDR